MFCRWMKKGLKARTVPIHSAVNIYQENRNNINPEKQTFFLIKAHEKAFCVTYKNKEHYSALLEIPPLLILIP